MLKIHGVPISVHTRKVIVAALEKGLPYHNEPVIPFKPPAGWDRISPTGKIPVVSDGDLDLADSSVICAYLEREHPKPPLYPSATRLLLQAYQKGEHPEPPAGGKLSEREGEVLRLTAEGYSNTEIGKQLYLSPKTVDTYRQRIMEKLGLHHRAELVRYALDTGLLQPHL